MNNNILNSFIDKIILEWDYARLEKLIKNIYP